MAMTNARTRDDFPHVLDIAVRWGDYNMAEHVSNVLFYEYIEEAVVSLLRELGLKWKTAPAIPFVAESGCRFLGEILFPSQVQAGIGIAKLGNSSLTYSINLFVDGHDEPVADAHFVHVFVDRETRRPVSIPQDIRNKAEDFVVLEV